MCFITMMMEEKILMMGNPPWKVYMMWKKKTMKKISWFSMVTSIQSAFRLMNITNNLTIGQRSTRVVLLQKLLKLKIVTPKIFLHSDGVGVSDKSNSGEKEGDNDKDKRNDKSNSGEKEGDNDKDK